MSSFSPSTDNTGHGASTWPRGSAGPVVCRRLIVLVVRHVSVTLSGQVMPIVRRNESIMDPTITVSLVGSAATIIAPVIALWAKRWIDERPMRNISANRLSALNGTWEGEIIRPGPDGDARIIFSSELRVKGKRISGESVYRDFDTRLLVTGWPLDASFIRIDYRDKRPEVIRHGCTITKLCPQGKELRGHYVGYNPELGATITGAIVLKKAP